MNLSLAPIQGMTTSAYRNAFAKIFGGIDGYYTPFITTTDTKNISPSQFKDLLPECNNSGVTLVPQLLSNNGADFRYFARAIVELGYKEINWNIGCPFPMVTTKKKGSGILPFPDIIQEVLDIACSDSSYGVTVKMRLGLQELEEGLHVIKLLNDYPLNGVIIHARTGKQMYSGQVNLDAFEVLNNACNHEVTYNGDLFTYNDFMEVKARFPSLNNFMLGRGALRDPFLPSLIKGHMISSADKVSMIKEFHDIIYSHYKNTLNGDKHLCDKMREFWTYMSVHLDTDGKLMKRIKKCHSSVDYLDVMNQMLGVTSMWRET